MDMGDLDGRRARTVEEMVRRFEALAPGRAELADFRPLDVRPSDVVIAPWAKSGTTMTQQMFHQLRMGAATGSGDMEFDDISRVVPWIETAPMLGFDLTGDQRAQPRGFKSHSAYHMLPPGMRYVVVLRDPVETYDSFYRFMEGWHFEPGAIPMEDFIPFWRGGGPQGTDYVTHLLSWWERRDEADTLLMTYRGVLADKRGAIRRLAKFIGINPDEALVDMVEEYTSRDFMLEHSDRFDDKMIYERAMEATGLPRPLSSSKVAAVSDKREVPQSVQDHIHAEWAERVEPVTGQADFASLAAALGR